MFRVARTMAAAATVAPLHANQLVDVSQGVLANLVADANQRADVLGHVGLAVDRPTPAKSTKAVDAVARAAFACVPAPGQPVVVRDAAAASQLAVASPLADVNLLADVNQDVAANRPVDAWQPRVATVVTSQWASNDAEKDSSMRWAVFAEASADLVARAAMENCTGASGTTTRHGAATCAITTAIGSDRLAIRARPATV